MLTDRFADSGKAADRNSYHGGDCKAETQSREADGHVELEFAAGPQLGKLRQHGGERSKRQFAGERVTTDKFPSNQRCNQQRVPRINA